MTQAPDENTVQVTAYAKVDAVHGSWPQRHPGIPVLVRVVAPAVTSERGPIDLVAVLDVSCCGGLGPANRMDLLKRAMELVIDKLSSQDRLAIVPVQASPIAETYHTTVLTKKNQSSTNVRNDQAISTTEKDKNSTVVVKDKTTPAVTEGDQTSSNAFEKVVLLNMDAEGRTKAAARMQSLAVAGDKKLSTALEKAVKILEGREDLGKNRAGFIVLISDGDDTSIFRATMNPSYSVHAFGFRDAHNARAMHFIANSSTGTYGILNDEHDGITEAFVTSIDNITSIVVIKTEVNISCGGGQATAATLSAIESGRFRRHIDDDRKNGFVMAGSLQAGAVRSFLVYVDNVGDDECDKLSRLLTVRVEYVSLSSSHHAEENRVAKEMKDAKVVVVRKGDENSSLVAAEIVRVQAFRVVGEILERYQDNGKGLAGGADELHKQWRRLRESEYGAEAGNACLISGLAEEIKEMEASIRRCSGMSYMLSWQTRHSLQHQTRTKTSSAAVATATAAVNGSSVPPWPSPYKPKPNGMDAGGAFLATGAAHHAAHAHAMVANCGDDGGVERKCKYEQYNHPSTELEMIEQRLAYWSKVKRELPPMHNDGECPDHMTAIFREASGESIDRAMYHDVFLAVAHATGRRSSKSATAAGEGGCSCAF